MLWTFYRCFTGVVLSIQHGFAGVLTALRSCRLVSSLPYSIPSGCCWSPSGPKLCFLSHEQVCTAVLLGLGCHQPLPKVACCLPSSALLSCSRSWSFSSLCLYQLSPFQVAWKEKRKLQSCWFLMAILLTVPLCSCSAAGAGKSVQCNCLHG